MKYSNPKNVLQTSAMKSISPIGFSQISRITDYVVNTELPDILYREDRQYSVDTTTIDNTMLVEENLVRVPLTLEEDNAYKTIDSTATLEEAFRPTGFLARAMLNDDNQAGEGSIGNSVNRVIPDGLSPQISFNRVEDFHLGIDYTHRLGRAIFQVQAGYNTHAKNWNHGGTIKYRWLDHTNVNSTLFGSHFVTNDDRYLSKYPHWLNSLYSLSGFDDYFDYFRNKRTSTGIRFGINRFRLDSKFTFHNEEHSSITGDVFDYSLFGWHKDRR